MHKLVPTFAALGLAATPAIGFLGAGPALAAGGHGGGTTIVDCAGHAHRAPQSLTLFCGDGNDTLTGLHWSGWGTARATASGSDVADTCEPSCVAGHDHSYRVTVSASQPKAAGNGKRYSRLTLTFTGARPTGTARVEHFDLTAKGPAFA